MIVYMDTPKEVVDKIWHSFMTCKSILGSEGGFLNSIDLPVANPTVKLELCPQDCHEESKQEVTFSYSSA